MPQLVPFYFINQVTFALVLLPVMIFVLSKFVILFLSRLFISYRYKKKFLCSAVLSFAAPVL
ncbi:hypothetical protein GcM1_247164 [Golovinomyces cichoracearum]|uniref:ATP synthase protein 8 n=1 Tax=Golovinomyces cichoracearum TaxID=62708 RepID=A0A420H8P8_9PEZI|nr:hypothetical protein GcM3_215003 [Golovinomyces cichoracearum]RKF56053.1 hypothetical protein GcC1_199003 [Golovinomyces cichoracearum]RKF72699.1 hypothetical protein GcM1_247164 [Golovinomyces cichoracearum]